MKVRVYWNTRKKTFSIQDYKTRKVIEHRDRLILTNVTFKVYESGRQRVLKTGHKNVHAFVIGDYYESEPLCYVDENSFNMGVMYNPRVHKEFVMMSKSYQPVYETELALLKRGCVFINV